MIRDYAQWGLDKGILVDLELDPHVYFVVNSLQKKFILMLTATPVENHLIELYNLIEDPLESVNLAEKEKATAAYFEARMQAHIAQREKEAKS
jgi:SNF2 family DNA or RNA helicase